MNIAKLASCVGLHRARFGSAANESMYGVYKHLQQTNPCMVFINTERCGIRTTVHS